MTCPHGYDTRQEGCPECNAVLEEMYASTGSGSEPPTPTLEVPPRILALYDRGEASMAFQELAALYRRLSSPEAPR